MLAGTAERVHVSMVTQERSWLRQRETRNGQAGHEVRMQSGVSTGDGKGGVPGNTARASGTFCRNLHAACRAFLPPGAEPGSLISTMSVA